MRAWIVRICLATLVILLTPEILLAEQHPANSLDLECSHPDDLAASSVVESVKEICIFAKSTAIKLTGDQDFNTLVDNDIKLIGEKIAKPSPFGKCWWDSRYDCYKIKNTAAALAQSVIERTDSVSVEVHSAALRDTRGVINLDTLQKKLIIEMDAFCNSLRH